MAAGAWKRGQRRWNVHPAAEGAAALADQLRVAPLIAQVLHHRGIDSPEKAQRFLNPKLTDLADPAALAGTVDAARRIAAAAKAQRRIVLYGDYDVDGITGVAILFACLKLAGADVGYYVPHRLDEGYGVNVEAVRKIAAEGAKLIVTVDCGISAHEAVSEAAAAGVDVIVTDHHGLGPTLPAAAGIVHPGLGGCATELSGAGVAFKLAWQLARELCGQDRVDAAMKGFLLDATCLAALGTIADVVPLVGENRVLATFGLRGLPASRNPGLRALIDCAGLRGEKIDAYHVGFVLAPRLNACGRMGHAALAVELLTEAGEDRGLKIAQYLDQQNTQRRQVEQEITAQAIEMAVRMGFEDRSHKALVLASEQWHGGVIGIVASRLVERFHRPAVLIALGADGVAHGSCRSIPGFHIRDALAACGEHLAGFGGHAMAGGLKIEPARVDAFREAMLRYAAERIPDECLTPALEIDAEAALRAFDHNVAQCLAKMGPFGQGNPHPVLVVRRCQVMGPPRRMGRGGQTIGLMLRQEGVVMRAVGFGMGDLADALVGVNEIDIAGEPALNEFNGRVSVEFKLKDVQW